MRSNVLMIKANPKKFVTDGTPPLAASYNYLNRKKYTLDFLHKTGVICVTICVNIIYPWDHETRIHYAKYIFLNTPYRAQPDSRNSRHLSIFIYYYLKTLMIADLALCTPGMVKSLAIITGQLN